MDQRRGLNGCQAVGIGLAILLVVTVCTATGLTLGGGIGLITGGAAGYAIGRAQSARIQPRIEVPLPQPPGDEERRLPEGLPEVGIRPYLGVSYETIEEGARIVLVEPGSPADRAGLREGDVILAVDGESVGEGNPGLADRILEYEPWEEVELRVRRDDEELGLEVTLSVRFDFERRPPLPPGEFPMPPDWPHPPEGWPSPPGWEWPQERPCLGVRVHQLEKGAEVLEIVPGCPAGEAGLREGDLILAVDDEEVTRETPLAFLIAAHKPGDTVVLTIERDGRELEVEAELGEWPAPEEPGATWEG